MNKSVFHEKNTYKWWVLVAVSIGSLTVSLDNSILAVCLPRLTKVFHTDSIVIGWLNIAFLIASQCFMLTFAKIGDEKGRKIVYMTGIAFYTIGLSICALSQGIGQLIFARTLQGLGAATTFSLSPAIAVAVFPAEERGKVLGIIAGVYSIGLVVAPVMGGFILDILGWRAVFYTRIPLALAALVTAWVVIKEQKNADPQFQFDIRGTVSLFGLLSCMLLYLSFGGKWGFAGSPAITLAALTIIFLFAFLHAEKRASHPVIDTTLFKERLFAAATLSATIYSLSSIAAVFLVPFYLMEGLGFSGSVVGVYMGMLAIPVLLIAPISGRLSDKIGSRSLSALGMFVNCLALYCLSRLGGEPTYIDVGICTVLVGCGMGIFMSPNNSAIIGSVPKDMLGTASAIAATARQIGVSSGIAIAGAIYSTHQVYRLTRSLDKGIDLASAKKVAVITGFHDALMVGLGIGIVGILTCLVRGSHKQH
jgi:EmrB/QacA subfamily drug resistance transporter